MPYWLLMVAIPDTDLKGAFKLQSSFFHIAAVVAVIHFSSWYSIVKQCRVLCSSSSSGTLFLSPPSCVAKNHTRLTLKPTPVRSVT